ncbi:MAG: WD40 repeat domain-containing protein, partial [Chloroflexota bacterium]
MIIDQFEELFTLVRDEETRDAFLNSLVTGVLDPKSRLRVVITLRADFVDRPLYYVDFGEMIKQRLMLLLPLSPDEMSSAIRYPLIESGMDAEPELVATLVREMGDQPGLLPLLQYTLTELFEIRTGSTLTLDAYRNIGGVAGSLSQRADEIYQDLTESQRELTRELFLRLVTLGEGNEVTRKRTKLAELNQLNLTGQDRGDLEQIIDAFGTFRLLTFDHDPITRQQTVEVAHEALLREWPRLRHWLSNSREDVRRQRELADAASAWYKNGEEDSYLLRGSRLASVEAWKDQSSVRLTREETRFLEASLESRDKVEKEEAERRERELQTAQQLAEAERGRAEEQAVSNMRLRRRALGLVGALLVAMILAGVAFRFAQTSNQNADEAAQQRDIAQQSEADALEAYSQALAANARQVLETDDQELALLLALAATNVENPSEAAWQTLLDIAYAPGLAEQIEVGDGAESMAISHSNQFILVGNQNGTVDVIDLDTQQVITSLIGHQGPVFTIRLSADDQFALSGSADNTAIFWDLERGEVVQQLVGHSDDVTAVDFLNGTAQAITGEFSRSAPGTLITWDLATGEALSRFGDDVETGNEQGISSLKATSDGKMALVGLQQSAASLQRQLNVWDIENQTLLHSLQLKELEFEVILINDVDISPNDQLGAAAADNGSIYIIDLHSGEITKRFDSHIGAVNSIRFSEDGFSIISAGSDGRIEWRLVDSGDILQTHQTASNAVSEALFWGESKAISLDHVGYVQMWDLTNQWRQGEWGTGVLSNDENVNELTFSPNGELVALTVFENDGRAGHRLILIDYETESVVWEHEFDVGLDSMSVLQFTPDGERLLTSPGDDTIAVWEVKTGQELNRLIGHKSTIRSVDISDDGKRAISTGLDNMVILWDIESGQPVRIMLGHLIGHGTTSVRFLKGDEFAASTAFDSSIIIWDLETGTQIKRLTGINSSIGNHLDGFGIFEIRQMQHNGMLLSVGRDQSIIMWDVVSGEPVKEFLGHGDLVRFMDVIGDGRTFLSSSTNNRLILWEVDGVNPKREFTPIG